MIMTPAAAPTTQAQPPRAQADQIVRRGLERAAVVLRTHGVPVPALDGKLLRPSVAYAMVPPARRAELDDRFWLGALAIQMVHEASLLHDDVLDEAEERRGAPTVYSERGVGAALVMGDHYLTAAYRAAVWTRSPDFVERFVTSVERTVAGEVLQGRNVGKLLCLESYFEAIIGKSGELFGAAGCLGACLLGLDRLDERAQLGIQIGALYQQVDDFLDYCPAAATGKEALKDYRQRKWTWVLNMAGIDSWDASERAVLGSIFGGRRSKTSAAHWSVVFLEVRQRVLLRELSVLAPGDQLIASIIDEWIDAARSGVEQQNAARLPVGPSSARPATPSAEAYVVDAATCIGGPDDWRAYFKQHARTFSFASRLFPAAERRKIEALYAYCRFTDDLVDEPGYRVDAATLEARLAVWRELSKSAFLGGPHRIALLSAVMGDASRSGVDWLYPEALLNGVGMDLRVHRYGDWEDLGRYTFCVAGAVGGWMSHLFGIRDSDSLSRAHSLGHAMQLTNILRDVGADLAMDRVYLPGVLLEKHSLSIDDLRAWQGSAEQLPERYADAMEEVIAAADERYAHAVPGIRSLPAFFRRPVAVAAEAYRGIHHEVRRVGYDNLRLRARTSAPRKAYLGVLGLLRMRPSRTLHAPTDEEFAT